MPSAVVVACDPAASDRSAIDFAAGLARTLGAPLVVAVVRPADALAGVESDDGAEPERPPAGLLRGHPGAELRALRAASPAAGLQRLLATERPRLVVLGSARGALHGFTRLGATAERALHGSPCPVSVVPLGHGGRAPGPVVVGVLPGPEGRGALALGAELARAAGAPLQPLAVLRRSPSAADARALAAGLADALSAAPPTPGDSPGALLAAALSAAAGGSAEPRVLVGDPVDALLRASAGAGMLVLGSRAYGPPGVVLPGGAARRVLAGARCPVVLTPRAATREPALVS